MSLTIGYAPGAFDLFHIGHLNLLREAKGRCDYLIAGVVADDVLIAHKGVKPVVGLRERLEIVRSVRFVDEALPAMTNDKMALWRQRPFDILFKGDDWKGTDRGMRLEREVSAVGVKVVYFPYTASTSSTALRKALQNIDRLAERIHEEAPALNLAAMAANAWPETVLGAAA